MKTHSCCTALLKMTEDWRNIIDKREAVGVLAVDLSKAFDAKNHRLLPAKLKTYHGGSLHMPWKSCPLTCWVVTMCQMRRRML